MSEDSTLHLQNADLRMIRERLESIDTRLGTLEDKVDQRLQETRPIWERAFNEIVETRVETRAEFVKVEDRLGRIENEIKDMRRMFRHTISDVTRVQADLEERLDKIDAGDRTQ
jgi:DNA repair ATPase RecN